MSKPDWKDAPEWVKFLAMDRDGAWWWFESEPRKVGDCWYTLIGRSEAVFQPISESWHDTLESRP